jgi:hypothetical protein
MELEKENGSLMVWRNGKERIGEIATTWKIGEEKRRAGRCTK